MIFSELSKQKNKPGKTAGMTLIEMLIYIAILFLVISTIVVFGVAAIRTAAKVKANSNVIENGRRAMEVLVFEIRKSESVYSPTSAFDINPGQLSLEQKVDTPDNEDSVFVDFFKCADSLCIKREGESPQSITSNQVKITNLVFSQLSNSAVPSIQITMRVESATASALAPYGSFVEITNSAIMRGY